MASFLQRLGRTGRRAGSSRNALFLATSGDALVHAAGLLSLWAEGWVEPVVAPPSPRHLVAQQLMGVCLQEHRVGDATWREWVSVGGVEPGDADAIVDWLVATGHLDHDSGMLFIGADAERRYGHRHFMDLVSSFTAEPQFTVIAGRQELGTVDPLVLTRKVDGPRLIVLAARSWRVTHIDWRRRRCWVEPADSAARMRWQSQPQPLSFEMCRARRDVLIGSTPPVSLSARAQQAIGRERDLAATTVASGSTVVDSVDSWWWTWAGARANATLAAALPDVVDARSRYENDRIRLRGEVGVRELREAMVRIDHRQQCLPDVDEAAIRGLKFGESLPPDLAVRTLAERLVDWKGVEVVVGEAMTRVSTA